MRKLLIISAALFLATGAAKANVIQSFGTDPTSATGAFNHSLGNSTSAFDDQYTFVLDHPMTLTIASVTNVFPNLTDFITNFKGSVFSNPDGIIGNADDHVVIGPVSATLGCGPITQCQGFAGSAFLNAGNYYLGISGVAGGSSGYGGNIATFAAVPGPIVGAGLPGLLAACFGCLWGLHKRRRRQ